MNKANNIKKNYLVLHLAVEKMGNVFKRNTLDPDSAWKQQNKEQARNPIYKYMSFQGDGKLIQAYEKYGPSGVETLVKSEVEPIFFYNGGKGSTITKVEYIRWKLRCQARMSEEKTEILEQKMKEIDNKSEKEILSLYTEDHFNKFTQHDACWQLNKRGGVGETPFLLCYLMGTPKCAVVAKIMLQMYPKLALDCYEGEEYYGESALHIAIVYGDFEAVKDLITHGANINQRATGRFFLPEDQKKGRRKNTNYEGDAYYGEYPLAFAACFGHEDIYNYLIDSGADPNLQDSFGNTVLHMVVIVNQVGMYKYAVKHYKKPAKTSIKNHQGLTALTLSCKLGRHLIFKEILEIGSLEFWRYSNITCSAYPLSALDSIGSNGDTNWNSALMIIINGDGDDHLEMLEGGVMRQLLDEKWKTFARRRFFFLLVLTFIHLILISIAVYTRPKTNLLDYTGYLDAIRFTTEIIICMTCMVVIAQEIREILSQGAFTFLKNCKQAPAQTIFHISCLLIVACIPLRFLNLQRIEDILLILAVPGSWFYLLFFARGFYLTGPFVTMIYKMIVGDLLRFAIIYVIFLVGFTQGFYFLFRNVANNTDSFKSLPGTVMTLFQMTLGEFKYAEFDNTRYSFLAKIVFAVFMILVPILLLNMLIAMMGNTYTQVISKSEKEWRKQWAQIVVVLERGFIKKNLLRFQQEYSIKLSGSPTGHLGDYSECDNKGEMRAIMVIKSAAKSKAKQRKGALANWKRAGKEIIRQLKQQRKSGKTGPLEIKKKRHRGGFPVEDDGLDPEENIFTSTVQQLAWEKDIDLTKGHAFVSDGSCMGDSSPGSVTPTPRSPAAERRNLSHPSVPNGVPKQMDKNANSMSTLMRRTQSSQSSSNASKLAFKTGMFKAAIMEQLQKEAQNEEEEVSVNKDQNQSCSEAEKEPESEADVLLTPSRKLRMSYNRVRPLSLQGRPREDSADSDFDFDKSNPKSGSSSSLQSLTSSRSQDARPKKRSPLVQKTDHKRTSRRTSNKMARIYKPSIAKLTKTERFHKTSLQKSSKMFSSKSSIQYSSSHSLLPDQTDKDSDV